MSHMWYHTCEQVLSLIDRKTPPPPGGFSIYHVPWSRAMCKRFNDEMRPSHLVVKSLTHGSWSGNIVNKHPRGGWFLSIYVHMCVCVYMYAYIYTYIYIHIYIFKYIHLYTYTYIHMDIYTYIHIYLYKCILIHVCMCKYIYVNIYISEIYAPDQGLKLCAG